MSRFTIPRGIAAIVAVLAVAAITIEATDDTDQSGNRHRTVTIRVDGSDRDTARDDPMRVPAVAVQQAARGELGDHEHLKSEQPVGVTPGQLDAAADQQDNLARSDQLPVVTPDAAPSQAGCRSRFVGSYSSRRGVAPRLFVVHYTVSPNRPGWSDVDGVTALFARPSFAASSNYVIDREAHCNYIVRESDKAWTQAAANPVAISVEIINTGREPNLIDGAGLKQLGRIISDATKRWHIPIQTGAVNGCTVSRAGVVTHQMLGPCGGGHVDVSPYSLSPVLAAARAARGGGISAVDRVTCGRLNAWRRAGRPGGHPVVVNVRRRQALERRHVVCTPAGPRRR